MSSDVATLRDELKHFVSLSDEQWSLQEKFGSTNGFHILLPDVRAARSLCETLLKFDLSRAPGSVMEEVSDLLSRLLALYARIQNISPNSIAHNRQPLIDEFKNLSARFLKETMALSAYLGATMESEIVARVGNLQEIEEKSRNVLDELRQASGKKGVSLSEAGFEKEAESHSSLGRLWLGTIAGSLASIIMLGLYFFSEITEPPKWVTDRNFHQIYLIQTIFAKILIVTAISYLLVLSLKSYLGHRHNNIVNRQKAVIMETFNLFLNAAGDDAEARTKVLMQACDSIFGERSSGYSGKDGTVEVGKSIVDLSAVSRGK